MATLSGVIADLRKDLLDTDATNYVWTDDQITRYIDHALIEVSQVSPRQATATYTYDATPTRELDLDLISGISSYITVEAVEYPIGKYPRQFVRFSKWANKLYLEIKKSPVEGEQVRVWFGKKHDFTGGAGSDLTLPDHLHELLTIGAAAYAAIAWGVRATNLVTVGGASVDRDYASWGMERLRFFRAELERLGKQAVGKQRKLYE